ncbi:MAG TPA: porin [Aquabacterium sp.]|nr:porin [Aquabacterium sp.]
MKIPRLSKVAYSLCAAGLSLLASGLSHADPTVAISGYGSLAATRTTQNDYEFRTSMGHSKGTGTGWDFGQDSRLGLQGVARFTDELSVTAQLLGQRRRVGGISDTQTNDDFNAGFEWAFAQYSPNSNVDLRAGRVVLPVFMISDSRNVGFSQPWLRAPLEVYGQVPLTTTDGVQALWRIPVGSAIFTVQPTMGSSDVNIDYTGTPIAARAKDVKGINLTVEYGDWLVRGGQLTSKTPFTFPEVDTGFGILPSFDHEMKDKFTSVGLQYDNGTLLVMAEWAKRTQNNVSDTYAGDSAYQALYEGALGSGPGGANYIGRPLASSISWYAAAGWRFGKWLPVLAYGYFDQTRDDFRTRSINASIRYDLTAGVALKAQVGRIQVRDPLMFVSPASRDVAKSTTSMAVGVDFVF